MTRNVIGLFIILFGIAAAPTFAEDSQFDPGLPQISWSDTVDHYGTRCVVYGTVVASKDIGSRCFLNFDKDFRTTFTAVVPSNLYGQFTSNPQKLFLNKHVRVVGEIVKFKDKPEIVIAAAGDIQIIDSPEPPKKGEEVKTQGNTVTPEATAKSGTPKAQAPTAFTPAAPKVLTDGVVKIATFNVLNLFDNFDDPYVDSEYYPGKRDSEIENLAKIIRQADADVVAFQEVENRGVLENFVATHLSGMGYCDVVLIEGNNPRGIDVGLISRLPVGEVTSHRHVDFRSADGKDMRFKRDLLQVSIEPEGYSPFDVFVVHLKSKHGGADESRPIRLGETLAIRKKLDRILTNDPQALFVICGDFNDTFDSEPLQRLVGSGDTKLTAFFDDLPEDKRITYNRSYLSMIDFVLGSPGMAGLYVPKSYDVILGTVETNGSDHNLVSAQFKLKKQP
ncbi:MAG TPA: endonuclease/exonuclease/phosphatase family protein [Phycisphaerae bacterium]|nr:endonuclease/exonuclease/phosphatase family protein [Phycisphaerae bacterium]